MGDQDPAPPNVASCVRRSRRSSVRVPTSSAASGSSRSSEPRLGDQRRASATRCACPPRAPAASRPRGRRARHAPSHSSARRAPTSARPPAAAQTERDVLEHGQVREQQVVLEHDADAAPLGRHERLVAGSSSTTPSSATDPRSSGTSPASARSNVVLPAPFGPRIATVSPSAASSATLEVERRRAARPTSASSVTQPSEPAVAQRRRARRPRPRAARGSARSRAAGRTRAAGRPRAASSACGPGCCRRR